MSSTLVTPLLISQPFGFGAANPTYINIPIPVPSQISTTVNAASFTDGFPPSTMTPEASGGLPFFGQDMNGILWMITAYCANFAAGALSEYNATLSSDISGYPLGVVLVNAASNGLWINQVAGNTTDPDAGGAGWLPAAGVGAAVVALSNANISLSAQQWPLPYIAFVGAITGNIIVTFPANTGQDWVVSNACTGAFTVTVKTAGGTGVVVPATGASAPTSVYCDGTNIQNTGVSTAGLAPIASPTFTGTPAAPTASPATLNNTQIATTAFVQAALTSRLATYAVLASPVFSGAPTAPTAAPGDNSLKLANTAFVTAAIEAATATFVKGGVTGTLSPGSNSVSFPTPFPTSCISVVVNPVGSTATYAVTSFTRFGFVMITGNGEPFTWMAIGN